MDTVSVTTKGQIVIPADLRKKYNIHKGSRVRVVDIDGQIVIKPLLDDPIKEGRGYLRGGKSLLAALQKDRHKGVTPLRVLDSFAALAYLEDEKGAARVERLLKEAVQKQEPMLISVVNWGEVYYITRREQGEKRAQQVIELLDQLPLTLVAADRAMTLQAASFKSRFALAYADCFAAALGILSGYRVLTGDPEFKKLEAEIEIEWLS